MAKPAKPEPGSVQIVGVALVAVWAKAMLNQERQFGFYRLSRDPRIVGRGKIPNICNNKCTYYMYIALFLL